jgi:hypothetical protein
MSAALTGTDLQRKLACGRLFRLDASKFRSGILNSYGTIPIAPQACGGNEKTGEIGSQSQSSRRKRCDERFPKRDI